MLVTVVTGQYSDIGSMGCREVRKLPEADTKRTL